jgi:hypothetical protein
MRARWCVRLSALGLAVLVLASASLEGAAKQRVVRLRNSFIAHIKNRAQVTNLPFTVDHAKGDINSISEGSADGDMHVAGRPGSFVALPMVAEVVNGRLVKDTVVARLRELAGKPATTISGVWRLWFEHPPDVVLVQGGTVPKPSDTNPDHIFELHPITEVDGRKAASSFQMVPGYTAYTAAKAFGAYEKLEFRATKNSQTTTISSVMAGHNYTEFDAVLSGAPLHVNDATFVLADIQTPSGKSVVARPIRLVITDGTDVATAFASKKPRKGTKLKALGIPRVNLDILMDQAEDTPGELVKVLGAYEIIIVGIR